MMDYSLSPPRLLLAPDARMGIDCQQVVSAEGQAENVAGDDEKKKKKKKKKKQSPDDIVILSAYLPVDPVQAQARARAVIIAGLPRDQGEPSITNPALAPAPPAPFPRDSLDEIFSSRP